MPVLTAISHAGDGFSDVSAHGGVGSSFASRHSWWSCPVFWKFCKKPGVMPPSSFGGLTPLFTGGSAMCPDRRQCPFFMDSV